VEEIVRNSQFSRRTFVRALAVGAAAPAFGGAFGGGFVSRTVAQEPVTLTVVSYGGSYQEAQDKAFFTPYQQANPHIKIQQDSPSSNAKLKAMVEAGQVTWDVVNVADDFGLDADAQWLEPIDYSIINRDDLIEGYASTYRVGSDVEATVMAYRTDVHKTAPKTFADYFDLQAFPGKRTAWKYAPGGIFETALLADGVPADKLYPIDVDRAFKKLDTIKDSLIWWDTGAQSVQFLTSGEASIGLLWCGRAASAADSSPVGTSWGQWTTQNGWWVVPKGTPNRKVAMEAIKFFTSPEAEVNLTKYLPYGPTNKHAVDKVDPRFKGNLPTDHLDTRVVIDFDWWNKNTARIDPLFQQWLLS
jgi:putative spermidine/putrescine transport system substrate-binding protein